MLLQCEYMSIAVPQYLSGVCLRCVLHLRSKKRKKNTRMSQDPSQVSTSLANLWQDISALPLQEFFFHDVLARQHSYGTKERAPVADKHRLGWNIP